MTLNSNLLLQFTIDLSLKIIFFLINKESMRIFQERLICLFCIIRLTTVGTFHGLNKFGPVIDAPQTSPYQNIAKLLFTLVFNLYI